MENLPAVQDDSFNQFASPAAQDMQFERMREIRLSVTLSDTRIPEGHLYLVDFDVPKGEKPKQTDLGTEITVNILRHAMKARKWDQEQDMNVIDSSEFRTFSDVVVLYDVYSIPNKIIAALPYTHRNKDLPAIGGKGENALKKKLGLSVRYVSYVLFSGEICRLNFTATDNSGADQDDKPLAFGKEAEDSFSGMLHQIPEESRSKIFLYDVKISSKKHQVGTEKVTQDGKEVTVPIFSKKIVLKTFTPIGIVPEDRRADVKEKLNALYKQISEQFWNKYTKAREATNVSKLDSWSQMILDKIDEHGTDPLLYSQNDQVKVLPQKDVVVDVRMIAAPDLSRDRENSAVSDVAAELEGGETFPVQAQQPAAGPVVDVAAQAKDTFAESDAPASLPEAIADAGLGKSPSAFQQIQSASKAKADAQGAAGGVAEGAQSGGDAGKGGVRKRSKPAA